MDTTTITLHTQFQIGRVDPRIFGGFLEHMGRAVYEGVYDPAAAHADADGFRAGRAERAPPAEHDGHALSRRQLRLRLSLDGRRRPAGKTPHGARAGLAEHRAQPLRHGRVHPALPQDGLDADDHGQPGHRHARRGAQLGRVLQLPAGARYADLRAANGSTEPHGVKLWCLGNEMDGPWQLGHVPADQYAIRAQQAAKMMKDADKSIELVACGSCTHRPADLHGVGPAGAGIHGRPGRLRQPAPLRGQPQTTTRPTTWPSPTRSTARSRRWTPPAASSRPSGAARSAPTCASTSGTSGTRTTQMDGEGKFAPHLIEEVYNLEDALVVAGFLNSFIRHADVREDRQPRADRQRHRADPDARRRAADPVDLLPLRDVLAAARRASRFGRL